MTNVSSNMLFTYRDLPTGGFRSLLLSFLGGAPRTTGNTCCKSPRRQTTESITGDPQHSTTSSWLLGPNCKGPRQPLSSRASCHSCPLPSRAWGASRGVDPTVSMSLRHSDSEACHSTASFVRGVLSLSSVSLKETAGGQDRRKKQGDTTVGPCYFHITGIEWREFCRKSLHVLPSPSCQAGKRHRSKQA